MKASYLPKQLLDWWNQVCLRRRQWLLWLLLCFHLVSWPYVWWCPWRFCSWSCLLHTLHTYRLASRSRPPRHSPLSVREVIESLTYVNLENLQPSRPHTRVTPLTSHSPRTHTLWGSLYEQRVPSRTTLCMKTTSRVSLDWQCRLQRLVAVKQTQAKVTKYLMRRCQDGSSSNQFLMSSSLLHMWLFFFSEWALSESTWYTHCLWVILQLHEPPETKPGSSTQWE